MEATSTKRAWIMAIVSLVGVLAVVWIIWYNISTLPSSADVNTSPIISSAPDIVSNDSLTRNWNGNGLNFSADLSLSSSSLVTLQLQTGSPVALIILYGQDPTNLNNHVTADNVLTNQKVELVNLSRNTSYYYQAVATTRNLVTVKSPIYFFKND